ncbi:MAG TPA: 3'-5' exonuclease [Candidatus Binatia bacterium]|nr:3'-5' exonuclease [Candidatus Binatia bacterium]
MIALELTPEQRRAVEAPYDGCFAITGAAASGKSTALAERVARLRALVPDCEPLTIAAPSDLDEYAARLQRDFGAAVALVDDVEAALLFERASLPLFAMEWEEFAQHQLDPEIPGLRSPERFLQSAFRLIRRLRDANVEPALFLSRALAGATDFYANPPNLADPALLLATKNAHHDSLDAAPAELSRQYRREIDLAKILAKLYEAYIEVVTRTGRMTGRDAAIAAAERLHADAALAASLRERLRYAFVDDAQNLTAAHLRLLLAIFGDRLEGVTLCGDAGSAFSPLHVVQPAATFALARAKVELREIFRKPRIEVCRVRTPREESESIAQRVGEWLAQGTRPERIAVLFRSVRNVEIYETALLDAGIPVVVAGDANVFADRRALDALALLWNVHDPFRHDWLLRTLGNPALGLSDASLAILCAEPPDPQRPLFVFDDEPAPTTRATRWSPQRDLRLGWNVIRGEQDGALDPDAAARLRKFRALRAGWLGLLETRSFEGFARAVWRDALAREGAPDSARARAQQIALQRLLERFREYLTENAGAAIPAALAYAEERIHSDVESCTAPPIPGCVRMLSIDAALGREFDEVAVADVRPGALPRWYSPDAFLFSPKLGMIPKENVGDARSARTAKFSYYTYAAKTASGYFDRERRAFRYALSRARKVALVTASGTPTRGVTAPEFLEELR